MKVGILTFPNSTSFGAALQMYALYHAAEELGADVEILNYHNAFMKAERHTGRIRGHAAAVQKLRLLCRRLMHGRQFAGFCTFEKTLAKHPKRAVTEKEVLRRLGERYSHVICGSDQVWNPNITDADMSYFLDFCGSETKRVSYAPSFGITEFSPAFRADIQKELLKFHSLSVREAEGQALVEQLTGKPVELVLDPTFLLTKAQWTSLERPTAREDGQYILYYTIKSSKTLLNFALKLAEQTNLKLLVVGGNVLQQLRNKDDRVEYAPDLEPRQWLSLIHHARYVVTNSFHGTAFSLIYQKDFYLEFSSETNSRLRQILETAGLMSRKVGEGCALWDEPIDYTQVAARLEPLAARSKEYLKAAICD